MKRLVSWLTGLPVAIVLIAFAVANRGWVNVSLDPLSTDAPLVAIAMPLWAVFFLGIFAGLMTGWAGSWLNQGKWRKAARTTRAELQQAKAENSRLKRSAASTDLVTTGH